MNEIRIVEGGLLINSDLTLNFLNKIFDYDLNRVAVMLGVIVLKSTQAINLKASSNAIDLSNYKLVVREAESGEAINGVTFGLETPDGKAE